MHDHIKIRVLQTLLIEISSVTFLPKIGTLGYSRRDSLQTSSKYLISLSFLHKKMELSQEKLQ